MSERDEPPEENHGEEHVVFRDIATLLVRRARAVPQVENPGNGEMVSYLVFSELDAHVAQLLVRVHPTRGSYACWQVKKPGEQYMHMLATFDAGVA